jgi:hypothetical protein
VLLEQQDASITAGAATATTTVAGRRVLAASIERLVCSGFTRRQLRWASMNAQTWFERSVTRVLCVRVGACRALPRLLLHVMDASDQSLVGLVVAIASMSFATSA